MKSQQKIARVNWPFQGNEKKMSENAITIEFSKKGKGQTRTQVFNPRAGQQAGTRDPGVQSRTSTRNRRYESHTYLVFCNSAKFFLKSGLS